MFRNVTANAHWLLGVTLGIVLAIMGITGALISFEDEILAAMNRDALYVAVPSTPRLSISELTARAEAAQSQARLVNLTFFAEANRAARVTYAPEQAQSAKAGLKKTSGDSPRPRNETRYLNPYTGELLGDKRLYGQDALQTIERIHRGIVAGKTGRALTGAATIALLFFALSGLYLRWPRSGALRWQTWFKVHTKLKGRPFLWNLHSVLGTWVLPIYLLSSLTGLYFAYDWYKQGVISMVGATPPSREAPTLISFGVDDEAVGSLDVAKVWSVFEQQAGSYSQATLNFPQSPKHAAEVRFLATSASHERAFDRIVFHPTTAAVFKDERYDSKSKGNRLISSMFMLHSGEFFGLGGTIIVLLASLTMPLFAITGWMMYLRRRKARRQVTQFVQTVPAISDTVGA